MSGADHASCGRASRRACLALAGLGLLVLAACGDPRQAARILRPDLADRELGTVVEPSRIRHEGVLITPEEPFVWTLSGPAAGRLRFAWGAQAPGTAKLAITVEGAPPRPAIERTFDAISGLFYEELPIATKAPAVVRIGSDFPAGVVISDLRIVQPSPRNDSLIVILLDTTRRDSIGLYGSRRPTTPNLDRIFARAWKAERAWAPASWTTPSVASLLTGRLPASQEDASGAAIGIAPDVLTLGHDFAAAGWSTAHFNANPALNVENGFARGFTTFYTPPYEMSSMALPGSDMLGRLPAWLAAHDGERFLLYLQLIEPHEPYGRPDHPPGKTPFDPDYTGRIRGDESHFALSFDPTLETRDVEHLRALYDDDVRYGDQLIGQFWDGLDPALRARATLVFLADHGEEFLEHGGWKHGPSLYDEVLRVPFLVRSGNGRSPLPTPADTLASLTDFLPTIEHHLEIPLRRPVDGVDLLQEKSWAREALPPIRMLTGGAARAVVVRRTRKLFFFDRLGTRGLPDERADPMGHRVALHLREFLPALGYFDLAADPGERRLEPPLDPGMEADWRAIEASLAPTRPGLELRVRGGDTASRLQFAIAIDGGIGDMGDIGDIAAERFALEPQDLVQQEAGSIRLDFDLSPGDIDGILLPDSKATNARVTLSSGCLRSNGAAIGPRESRAIEPLAEGVPRFTGDANCSTLFVWRNRGGGRARSQGEVDEEREKLRALGYIH